MGPAWGPGKLEAQPQFCRIHSAVRNIAERYNRDNMGDDKGSRFVKLILIAVICILGVLIAAHHKTVEEKRKARAEELLCPSILRDIETARAAREQIPAEVAATAEQCKQLGYSRKSTQQ
jgi:hypothetical protein